MNGMIIPPHKFEIKFVIIIILIKLKTISIEAVNFDTSTLNTCICLHQTLHYIVYCTRKFVKSTSI